MMFVKIIHSIIKKIKQYRKVHDKNKFFSQFHHLEKIINIL